MNEMILFVAMEIVLGAIRIRQILTKIRKRAMNGMVCRTKMDKMIRTHGPVVTQINDTNTVKGQAIIVLRLQNHRKFNGLLFISFHTINIKFLTHKYISN